MATQQETDLILEMLASGRINAAQARMLFDAVERCSEDEQDSSLDFYFSDFTRELRHDIERELKHAARHVRQVAWEM